jgi:hypothetical protein
MVFFAQRSGIGLGSAIILMFLASVAAAGARADETVARPVCDQDRGTGEPPTISSRFDLKDSEPAGTSFAQARDRAVRWCEQQSCTVEGRSVGRTASIYALGVLNRRYIAGFRCIAAVSSPVARTASDADLTFTFGDPSEIDAVLAKANMRCAPTQAKAELVNLERKGGASVAVFNCRP